MQAGVDVRRSADRFRTDGPGWQTWHALSGGRHYDPANTAFGPLVVHDEHLLEAGAGFPDHRHRGVEVVSWVLEGALRHTDSTGTDTLLLPGTVQVLSAGSGVLHSERAEGPTRFVQAWLLADHPDAEPGCARADLGEPTGLVPACASNGDAPLRLGTAGAALQVGRLAAEQPVRLPDAPRVHLHVAAGAVELDGAGRLEAGDAARLTAASGPGVVAVGPARVLVWSLPA